MGYTIAAAAILFSLILLSRLDSASRHEGWTIYKEVTYNNTRAYMVKTWENGKKLYVLQSSIENKFHHEYFRTEEDLYTFLRESVESGTWKERML